MCMPFFGVGMLVAGAVRMTAWSMAVPDIVEKYETDKVRSETEGADDENELWLRYLLGFDESLNGFKEDGETQCDQENAVYESAEGFGTLPLHAVSTVSTPTPRCSSPRMCIS